MSGLGSVSGISQLPSLSPYPCPGDTDSAAPASHFASTPGAAERGLPQEGREPGSGTGAAADTKSANDPRSPCQVLKSLNKTYQNLKRKPVAVDLDPKAVTCDELFGIINPATREWKDGRWGGV